MATSNSPSSEATKSQADEAISELAMLTREDSPGVIACEGTAEGVLAGVGLGYLAHANPALIRLAAASSCQPTLEEAIVGCPSDVELARRVYDGFERTVVRGCSRGVRGACPGGCSGGCGRKVLLAAAVDDPDMPETIHRYLRVAFARGPQVRSMIAHPDVAPFLRLAQYATYECERVRQFARFSHMSDDSFVGTVRPRADVLPFVAGYFVARMSTERFCLVDVIHQTAVFHETSHTNIVRLSQADAEALSHRTDLAEDERYIQAMWKRFYDGLELQGRGRDDRGYDLRQQFMPRRVWDGMPEFDVRNDDPGPLVPSRYAGCAGNRKATLPEGKSPHEDRSLSEQC